MKASCNESDLSTGRKEKKQSKPARGLRAGLTHLNFFIFARDLLVPGSLGPQVKSAFGGAYIANQALTFESATQAVSSGRADAAAFGKIWIANPDLVARFAKGAPLNALVPETIYAEGASGYTDYPEMEMAGVG